MVHAIASRPLEDVLFTGWAVDHQEVFQLLGASWPAQRDQIMAAIGLLVATILYAPLIPLAVFLIYWRHLTSGTDGTVLPRWLAMTCATGLPVFTLIVAALMAVF
jgi:hypothetical protein